MLFCSLWMAKKHSALTIEQALEILFQKNQEDATENADVIIVPPDVDELTDEEDISEEIIGEASVQDIPGSFEVKMNQQPIENHAKDREGSAKSCRKKQQQFFLL